MTQTNSLPTEKQIGDFTARVVKESAGNGPFAVRLFGGPSTRTLAVRFTSEAEAAKYLAGVSSRTVMELR